MWWDWERNGEVRNGGKRPTGDWGQAKQSDKQPGVAEIRIFQSIVVAKHLQKVLKQMQVTVDNE